MLCDIVRARNHLTSNYWSESLDFQLLVMEGVKAEVWRQVIMNFCRKNMDKGEHYTIKYFAKLDVGKIQAY